MTTSRSEGQVIRIAAAVVVDAGGRLLLVRKRGTEAFILPGGKLEEGEAAIDALDRELIEELGCPIGAAHRPLGRFTALAANETGATVDAELFAVDLAGEITTAAEIAELRWHDPAAPAGFAVAPLARDAVFPLVQSWGNR